MFEAIKSVVTVPMVLERYTTNYNGEKRIQCPIHLGENKNFSVKENSYYCFKCGSSGDVINLVQALMDVSARKAAEILENDFKISTPTDIRAEQFKYEQKRIKRERDKRIEMRASNILSEYMRNLSRNTPNASMEKQLTEKNYDYLREESMIEYFCDIFTYESFETRMKWIEEHTEYLKRLIIENKWESEGELKLKSY